MLKATNRHTHTLRNFVDYQMEHHLMYDIERVCHHFGILGIKKSRIFLKECFIELVVNIYRFNH